MRAVFLICMMLIAGWHGSHARRMPDLIPYNDDSLWGYSDRAGHVRIVPQWKEAGFFKGDKARVTVLVAGRSYFALINKKGAYIIPPERNWNGSFNHGWAGAGFNTGNDQEGCGLIDSTGRVIIPASYHYGQGSQFAYQPGWKQYVMVATRDGKRGIIDTGGRPLIPFEYDNLGPWGPEQAEDEVNAMLQQRYAPGMCRLIIAIKDKKPGLIDLDNRVVAPFGQYEYLGFTAPCWFYCVKAGAYGLLDTTGHTVIPPVYESFVTPAGADYFIAGCKGNKPSRGGISPYMTDMGMVDKHNNIVLPFCYSSVTMLRDTIRVVVSDSTLPPDYPDNWNNRLRARYTRYLNSRTLKPYGDWHATVWEEPFEGGCSGNATMRALQASYEQQRPRIDGYIKEFKKDSIAWRVVREAGPGHYAVQGYKAFNDSVRRYTQPAAGPYIAIVNEHLAYEFGPLMNGPELLYLNAADKLLISARSANGMASYLQEPLQYALLDYRLHEIMPYQSIMLLAAFRWKGKVYALVPKGFDKGPCCMYLFWESNPEYRLIDASGQAVQTLAPYVLNGIYREAGTAGDKFSGYFMATDSLGRKGIVSLEGKVQMPAISFRNKELKPQGHGLYLTGGKDDYAWVNGAGKAVVPGLRVLYVSEAPADAWSAGYVHWSNVPVPGVYQVTVRHKDGKDRRFYVTENGVVHAAHVP